MKRKQGKRRFFKTKIYLLLVFSKPCSFNTAAEYGASVAIHENLVIEQKQYYLCRLHSFILE